MHVDYGAWCIRCTVVTVWSDGARPKVVSPIQAGVFFLLFTTSASPVYRRCKKVWTRSNEIEVEFQRKEPSTTLADSNGYGIERSRCRGANGEVA